MGSKTRTIMEKQAKINFDNNLNQQTSQQFYTMNPYCQTQMQYPQQQVYQHSDSTTSPLNSCISSSASSNWKNELLSIPSPSPEDFKYSAFDSLRLSESSNSGFGWSQGVAGQRQQDERKEEIIGATNSRKFQQHLG